MSRVVRLEDEVYEQIKRIAAMQGTAAGEMIALAWREYFDSHREELAAQFEAAAKLAREGDSAGMAALMNRGNEQRAARAAESARSGTRRQKGRKAIPA